MEKLKNILYRIICHACVLLSDWTIDHYGVFENHDQALSLYRPLLLALYIKEQDWHAEQFLCPDKITGYLLYKIRKALYTLPLLHIQAVLMTAANDEIAIALNPPVQVLLHFSDPVDAIHGL